MAHATKTKLLGWLQWIGATLFIFSSGAAAESIFPELPPGMPWWAWLLLSMLFGGATLFTAVTTSKRQARKTALEEYASLHEAERKGRQECEERARAQQQQLLAYQGIAIKMQTQNQRQKISIHQLRTMLTQVLMQNGMSMDLVGGLKSLVDDDDDEGAQHENYPAG